MPPATSVRSIHLDSGAGMGGGTGGYDQSLLAATSEVSKAAKQESYNIDLLEDHPSTGSPVDRNAANGVTGPGVVNKEISYSSLPNHARVNGIAEEERYYRGGHRRPWHRRPAGIITLAILFIVIVGAIVGGAVGGTVGHHKDNNSQQQQQQQGVGTGTTPTTGQGTQGTTGGVQGVGTDGPAPFGSVSPSKPNSSGIVLLPTSGTQQTGSAQGGTTGQLNVGGS